MEKAGQERKDGKGAENGKLNHLVRIAWLVTDFPVTSCDYNVGVEDGWGVGVGMVWGGLGYVSLPCLSPPALSVEERTVRCVWWWWWCNSLENAPAGSGIMKKQGGQGVSDGRVFISMRKVIAERQVETCFCFGCSLICTYK